MAKSDALKPEIFGRYVLLDRMAAGGMAEVYRAQIAGSDDFQRIMAIKKILPHVAEDEEFITMFKDEAKITVQLQHSNIGQVYDFNKVGEVYFIAMEYISGKDLKAVWSFQRKRKKKPLDIMLSCHVVQKMADGLDYSHRKADNFGEPLGIVHRDVSPQNVLVSWDGEVKVIDFGIAKAAGKSGRTQAGVLKGKFGYMAPEQIRGVPLDGRADVFALGVTLYEMLTGTRAFRASSDFALLEKVRAVDIMPAKDINPNIPDELIKILMKALAKERDDRYWGSELSEALQRFALLHSKPANRHDLGDYMKKAFPDAFDKERLRLQSYKDLDLSHLKPHLSQEGTPVKEGPSGPVKPKYEESAENESGGYSVSSVETLTP